MRPASFKPLLENPCVSARGVGRGPAASPSFARASSSSKESRPNRDASSLVGSQSVMRPDYRAPPTRNRTIFPLSLSTILAAFRPLPENPAIVRAFGISNNDSAQHIGTEAGHVPPFQQPLRVPSPLTRLLSVHPTRLHLQIDHPHSHTAPPSPPPGSLPPLPIPIHESDRSLTPPAPIRPVRISLASLINYW